MGEFVRAALAFPAVLFSFALVVVAGYWLLVLVGGVGVGHGGHDGHGGPWGHDHHPGHGNHDSHTDAAGVPVTVTLSFAIAVTWFVALVGTALTDRWWLRAAALLAALGLGRLTALGVRAAGRRLFPPEKPSLRGDFVGRTCVVRTGRVGADFGQAEVRAEDGSTAILQVRTDESGLGSGSTALIFDYDVAGEVFLITAFDGELDPPRPAL
jgi:hypothetical protein